MIRFQRKPSPAINAAIVGSTAAILAVDLIVPLGFAVWVFYLVPIVLSFYVWRPRVPLYTAGAMTFLTIISYIISTPSKYTTAAVPVNRGFGILTGWALAAMGNQFIKHRLMRRRQEWLQVGQTSLSQRIAGDLNLKELGERTLQFVGEYLDAHAATIFIEDHGIYRRFGTYAIPENAAIPSEFKLGDGLLGQAAKDKKSFILDNAPEGYLTIGSSLGRSSPASLLIAPAIVEGHVNAVTEIGFVHPVLESDTELMRLVSESIAVAVRSAHYRARLHELLDQTQRQSEELQTQSEELRVTNEELEEQSRALKESQTRLEEQQAELEQTNSQLSNQAQTLELQRDELAKTSAALELQKRELQQASGYKSAFLANMSHELRTPLNSSLILAKLLACNRDGNLTEEQIRYAKTIESAGNDLLTLINDVLDLSKVEAGHIEIKPQEIRVAAMADTLRATFQPIADQKSLALEFRIGGTAPQTIYTDEQRLQQVLKNLLSNAIKFTDGGRVTLEITPVSDDRVAFSVSDTGIGIPPNEQQVIFEPFRQADGSTNRKYGGTGLGLSIAREFVRLLGGEIELKSTPGQGSSFTVILPVVYAASMAKSPLRSPPLVQMPLESIEPPRVVAPPVARPVAFSTSARIADDREKLSGARRTLLIVEDDEDFARILFDLAHEMEFQAIVATTAEEAITLAVQHSPSAVVLDIGLPDQSGLSVLDRLKTDSRTRHIPVHVVSGSDHSETAYAMGAAGYMLKPVPREQLIESLQRLEHRLTQKLRRVLIVEDNDAQRESISRLLETKDVKTDGVSSASECLDKLRTQTFDCMVLDLSLPDASGFALLETLSREDKYSFPPVIVYTGRDLPPDEEQRLRKYSKSIIIKGARSPERLLDEVTLFLHQVVADLPAQQRQMIQQARSRDAVLEGRRILIVEDDVRNVFALTSLLEPHGVTLEIARNGVEAIEKLNRSLNSGVAPIDLVLMDIMMPEMDGLTATKEIRKRSEFRKLPILALTAKAMKNDQEHALAAGANDYMAKPLDVDKLLSLIRVWIRR